MNSSNFNTNLSVCDGDDISGDVRRHITSLSLDNGESGEGAATKVVVHLGSSLQQTGVKVEHITGVGLATRGTTQQQRHLTVGNGLRKEKSKLQKCFSLLGNFHSEDMSQKVLQKLKCNNFGNVRFFPFTCLDRSS